MKHLVSNAKNINESLKQMTNYIKNNKANNVIDLKGIDEAAWNFITSIYDLCWDLLITDKYNHTLRQKVAAKFTHKLYEIKKKLTNKKIVDKPASFVRIPPPISVKNPKEVNEICKYFKENSQLKEVSKNKKSYTQASKLISNIKEILKIKETFPNLQANKIVSI